MNAYGSLMMQRVKAMNVSIRCPECTGLNAERDARFAPPRQYFSPDIDLSTALQIKGADLLIIAGKIIACGDADIARRLYIREIHAALNCLDEAINAFERNGK